MKTRSRIPTQTDAEPFLRSVSVDFDGVADASVYPYAIPAIAKLGELAFHPKVTFLVGENGSGKSTLRPPDRPRRDRALPRHARLPAAPERFFRTLFRRDDPAD